MLWANLEALGSFHGKMSKELGCRHAVRRVDSAFNFFTGKVVHWVFGSPFLITVSAVETTSWRKGEN